MDYKFICSDLNVSNDIDARNVTIHANSSQDTVPVKEWISIMKNLTQSNRDLTQSNKNLSNLLLQTNLERNKDHEENQKHNKNLREKISKLQTGLKFS